MCRDEILMPHITCLTREPGAIMNYRLSDQLMHGTERLTQSQALGLHMQPGNVLLVALESEHLTDIDTG